MTKVHFNKKFIFLTNNKFIHKKGVSYDEKAFRFFVCAAFSSYTN